MKKLIFITLILPLVLVSCEMNPEAYFSATPGDPVAGEVVEFTNRSHNADRFEWDFGDGYISDEVHPSHVYTASGSFNVILKVWSETGLTDEAALTINVKIPTLLEIEVLEYFDEYPVAGASVILYPTLNDWDNERNIFAEGYTDTEGKVVFCDLNKAVYFVDVWEADHDNYSLRDEDIGFIRTSEIKPNTINRFIAYVDFVDHSKGENRRDRQMVIRKIERKVGEKPQVEPYADSDSSEWQSLYLKSIRKK